jgi:hypothetical protein
VNDQQIDALKQFIVATFSQTEENLVGKIANIDSKIKSLWQDVQDGFVGVSEAIENPQNYYDETIKTTDRRLKKARATLNTDSHSDM